MRIKVGQTGYVYVLDSKGAYIISKDGKRDGESLWEAKDADGTLFIQAMVRKGLTLKPKADLSQETVGELLKLVGGAESGMAGAVRASSHARGQVAARRADAAKPQAAKSPVHGGSNLALEFPGNGSGDRESGFMIHPPTPSRRAPAVRQPKVDSGVQASVLADF